MRRRNSFALIPHWRIFPPGQRRHAGRVCHTSRWRPALTSRGWRTDGEGAEADFHRAVQAVTPYAHWTRTYTEAEVGAHFLRHYGYFELVGPTGHYIDERTRAYVAYWGAGLDYDWHSHQAEELYFVVSGSGHFRSEGDDDAKLGRGGVRTHRSNQRHALRIEQDPILTFVLWRGPGLTELPVMAKD